MMLTILQNLSADDADTYSLVLSSAGIFHRLIRGRRGWELRVNDTDYEKALNAVATYIDENPGPKNRIDPLYSGEYRKTFTGVWVSVLLLVFYAVLAKEGKSEVFIDVYGSSAYRILNGEIYRSVTSLMLHANPLHILGNMAGISIFATFVCSIMGSGVGWLTILATGAAGNLINALLHRGGHVSIGASTAVFGAIGILSAYQFVEKFRAGQRVKALLPLCGGLALLGFLGSGEHSDLTAHLFGFLCGIAAGLTYSLFAARPASATCQTGSLVLAFCLVAAAWLRAF